jgi:hypothetical protein
MKIDPVYIRKAVKNGELNFYLEKGIIYCEPLPKNGECFIVGMAGTCKGCKHSVPEDEHRVYCQIKGHLSNKLSLCEALEVRNED